MLIAGGDRLREQRGVSVRSCACLHVEVPLAYIGLYLGHTFRGITGYEPFGGASQSPSAVKTPTSVCESLPSLAVCSCSLLTFVLTTTEASRRILQTLAHTHTNMRSLRCTCWILPRLLLSAGLFPHRSNALIHVQFDVRQWGRSKTDMLCEGGMDNLHFRAIHDECLAQARILEMT